MVILLTMHRASGAVLKAKKSPLATSHTSSTPFWVSASSKVVAVEEEEEEEEEEERERERERERGGPGRRNPFCVNQDRREILYQSPDVLHRGARYIPLYRSW